LIRQQFALSKRLIDYSTANQVDATGGQEAATTIEELLATQQRQGRQWLYTAVGQALSTWAMIEENLVVIATLLLKTDPAKAGLILYSIFNFNTWLSIIEELFRIEPDYRKLLPSWNRISHQLRSLKNTRDRLAHQTIFHRRAEGDIAATDISLRPARFDTRIHSTQHPPLDVQEIFKFQEDLLKMSEVTSRLLNSMTEIIQASASPEKSPE
jgi:hypothetical protein